MHEFGAPGVLAAFRERYSSSGIVYVTSSFHRENENDMPKTFSEPTCLAKPWAAAWALYAAHAVKQGYAKHLVPRPCAEEPSGSCLPAACAE